MSETQAMDEGIAAGNRDQADEELIAPGLVSNKSEDQTPGEMLREARLAAEYSIADMCGQTMLSRRTMEALEDNRFDELSQPVFVRGYYRKCAKVLDLDAEALLAAYDAYGGARLASAPAIVHGVNVVPTDVTPDRRRTFGAVFMIAILLIIGFAGYLFWSESGGLPSSGSTDTLISSLGGDAERSAEAADQSALQSSLLPLGDRDNTDAATAGGVAAAMETDTAADTQAADTTASVADQTDADASGERFATVTPPADAESATAQQTATATAAAATADEDEAGVASTISSTALTLEFDDRSWVDVRDANGQQLLVGNFQSTTRTVDGTPPYNLVLGFAPGVSIRLGGEPVDFEVKRNKTARFTVDAEGS